MAAFFQGFSHCPTRKLKTVCIKVNTQSTHTYHFTHTQTVLETKPNQNVTSTRNTFSDSFFVSVIQKFTLVTGKCSLFGHNIPAGELCVCVGGHIIMFCLSVSKDCRTATRGELLHQGIWIIVKIISVVLH